MSDLIKNNLQPPYTDRGVQNTSGAFLWEKNILVDWFQCSIKECVSPYIIFTEYLHISKDLINYEEKGLYCYDRTYSYKGIEIMQSSKSNNFGTFIYMTGSACRDFESLGLNFIDFFRYLFTSYTCNVSRLDIAIDVFNDRYFTIAKIRDYINNKQVVSRFKSSVEFIQKSLSNSNIESETIWFGSRTSNIQIVFYNKKQERINRNYEVDKNIEYWFRCETRFRNEVANNLILTILQDNDYITRINEVLFNYLDFKDISLTESNKSRWVTSQWWLDYLETNKKLSLGVNIKESSITCKRKWLNTSVSKTNFMVYVSDLVKQDMSIDIGTSDYLYDFLKYGEKKITKKDLDKINDYRIVNGLEPLTLGDLETISESVSKLIF